MYATVAEDLLEEISDYAVKWGAILLVDGADFLLQARKEHGDLKRSDLVAVFFRFIEKHRGVLFMTTNHVTRLDPAIQSRLDITIGLPPLDRAARAKIWHVLLDEQVENGTIDAEHCTHLKTLAEQEWSMQDTNGHQLKHALKTALVVAEKRGRMVGAKEIGTMLRIGKEFGERAAQIEKSKGRVMEKERARVDLEGFEEVESP